MVPGTSGILGIDVSGSMAAVYSVIQFAQASVASSACSSLRSACAMRSARAPQYSRSVAALRQFSTCWLRILAL